MKLTAITGKASLEPGRAKIVERMPIQLPLEHGIRNITKITFSTRIPLSKLDNSEASKIGNQPESPTKTGLRFSKYLTRSFELPEGTYGVFDTAAVCNTWILDFFSYQQTYSHSLLISASIC
jgi:hypothetical protein